MITNVPNPTRIPSDRTGHGAPCPRCDAELTSDPRFTAWCPGCDWNLVPGEDAAPEPTRRERAAAARSDRLFEDQLEGRPSPTARRDWLLASVAAGLIHLVTLTLCCLGIWLVVAGTTVQRCAGAVVLVIVLALRPRLGRVPRGEDVLDRTRAPALFGLADRVAAEVGAAPADVIVVDDDFNASYGLVGLRRRAVLTVGLPLWETLDDRQRVALLGHEFGHRVNGDHRRSLWLHSAVSTLAVWYDLARGGRNGGWGSAVEVGESDGPRYDGTPLLVKLGAILGAAVLRAVAWLMYQGLLLFDRLTSRAGQQAEYGADALAARVGGSEAAHGMLTALLLSRSAGTAVSRIRAEERRRPRTVRRGRGGTAERPGQPPEQPGQSARTSEQPGQRSPAVPEPPRGPEALWERMREHLASVPATEHERLLRLSARDRAAVDSSHPPTHLRIAVVRQAGARPAAVSVSAAEGAAIAAELAPHRARIAAELLAG
ncbi:M48 family metalloprotease [Kitasatospora sp. NPDC085464]|uniref:M48 family metalloprotease n=1 Tax=Kitasatospora sp. NPDC085464 TaxID=3364063 RepID=UPI0037C505C0